MGSTNLDDINHIGLWQSFSAQVKHRRWNRTSQKGLLVSGFRSSIDGYVRLGSALRMITNPSDLEPLLGQYEPGLILVGPLLSYSIGGYRYFYIAANGSKVYETVGLGVFENEADAEAKRADIIATLKSRFTEVLTFDTHREMAHAANTRWPN